MVLKVLGHVVAEMLMMELLVMLVPGQSHVSVVGGDHAVGWCVTLVVILIKLSVGGPLPLLNPALFFSSQVMFSI